MLPEPKGAKKPAPVTLYDVRHYGAKGDGINTDHQSINKAINAAADAGGGTVYFSPGTYLCFSIHLQSNTTLYLEKGATIFAANPEIHSGGYDAAEPNEFTEYQDFGHSHWQNSLIWGIGLENISILGPGLINGSTLNREAVQTPGVGNKAIGLKLCKNITLSDFSIVMGGHFAVLATGVENITLNNLTINTNRDGINIDCCKNITITGCNVNSPWDDAICLKSSYALGYAQPTENLTITNCKVSGFDRGIELNGPDRRKEGRSPVAKHAGVAGRIKFGTESNGGFKNITITDCEFEMCRGLALETVDGGLLEDVTIAGITMCDIVSSPIFLCLGARMRGPAGAAIGRLRSISISNVKVYNADPRYACLITGIPGHDIEDVQLNNIIISFQGGGTAEQALIDLPENEREYPDPIMFGATPSYGFFIRHVSGLEMNDVQVSVKTNDFRPAFILDDVKSAKLSGIKASRQPATAVISLRNVAGFSLTKSGHLSDLNFQQLRTMNIK